MRPSDRSSPPLRLLLALGLALLAFPFIAYTSAYAHTRLTHGLVHHGNGSIGPPTHFGGLGWSTKEIAFAPIIFVEGTAQRALGR